MKKTFSTILIITCFFLISCNNNKFDEHKEIEQEQEISTPEEDAEKMFSLIKKYTSTANTAMQDRKLDLGEIKSINSISSKISNFEKNLDQKYQKDEVGGQKIQAYIEENQDRVLVIYDEYYDAIGKIHECTGSDKLK